jgi:hypothetical protein
MSSENTSPVSPWGLDRCLHPGPIFFVGGGRVDRSRIKEARQQLKIFHVLARGQIWSVVLCQTVDCPFCVDRDHQSGCWVRFSVVKAAESFPGGRNLEAWIPDNDLVGVSVDVDNMR